ncbi:MAG: hypothetical protein WB770_02990 [Acidimicrobiales bacterium]
MVATVRNAWRDLSPTERKRAVLVTANYGEAGALNELGHRTGLPIAYGTQNSEWWWGPGDPHATVAMVVAPGPRDVTGYGGYLEQFFANVQVVATLRNHAGIHNQEWGGGVYLCSGLRRSWSATWVLLRHYN